MSSKLIDLTGKTFGRWKALEYERVNGTTYWKCECSCGTIKSVQASSLKDGKSQSCGCLKKEQMSERFKTHGMTDTKEYQAYARMLSRCTSPSNPDFEHYTSRGISVCSEFLESFENFYKEIGPRPVGRWSVGRIDNTQGYNVGNVRWEDDDQQARNHSLQKNNTSGYAGICVRDDQDNKRIVARIGIGKKKRLTKTFNIRLLGLEEALAQAVAWRKEKIEELKLSGIIYGDFHGQADKEVNDEQDS